MNKNETINFFVSAGTISLIIYVCLFILFGIHNGFPTEYVWYSVAAIVWFIITLFLIALFEINRISGDQDEV